MAYDALALGVSAGQILDFQLYAEDFEESLTDVGRRGEDTLQLIDSLYAEMLQKIEMRSQHAVCGHCAVVERDGTMYRCDRYVFDEYRMGNICREPIAELMESNRAFGEYKLESLPPRCLHCDVADLCFGGCPKDRIVERVTLSGVVRHNHLCAGYRLFFRRFKTVFASCKGDLQSDDLTNLM